MRSVAPDRGPSIAVTVTDDDTGVHTPLHELEAVRSNQVAKAASARALIAAGADQLVAGRFERSAMSVQEAVRALGGQRE